jgi:hypothetical protein
MFAASIFYLFALFGAIALESLLGLPALVQGAGA